MRRVHQVLCAGMARSGSTWLYRSVCEIMSHARPSLAPRGFMNTANREWRNILQRGHLGVWKIHNYAPGIGHGVGAVITSHRDIRWVFVSAQAMSDMARNEPLEWCLRTIDWHRKWIAHENCNLDVAYEKAHKNEASERKTISMIAAALGQNLSQERIGEIYRSVRGKRRYLSMDTADLTVRIAQLKKMHRRIPDDIVDKIKMIEQNPECARYIKDFGYPKKFKT